EFLFIKKHSEEIKKYKLYFIIGVISLLGGLILTLVPDWYANKRQVTLTYILISLGTSILISFFFIALDKKIEKPIFGLDSFGKNPFIIYIIAEVLSIIVVDIIGYDLDIFIGILLMIIVTIIAVVLDRYGKILKL
ncbi:MAG: hypothetical protein ACFFDY_08485, partial [Candidatus Thorarchaeota archaeon]